MVFNLSVLDVLSLGEQIILRPFYLYVQDVLLVNEIFHSSIIDLSVVDKLTISENVQVGKSIGLLVTDALTLAEHSSPRMRVGNREDILFIAESYVGYVAKRATDILIISETFTGYKAKAVKDNLVIQETITLQKVQNLVIVDTLSIIENRTGFISDVNYIGVTVPPCN